MKVTFDSEGYLQFLSTNGDLPNSVELPDDEGINYKYLNCYRLNDTEDGLVLDAERVQALEQNLITTSKIMELKRQLNETDYKVLRKIREDALGIKQSMTEKEYLLLEAGRESLVRQIREIEEGKVLVTDVLSILFEQDFNEVKDTPDEPKQEDSTIIEDETIKDKVDDVNNNENILEDEIVDEKK